MASDLSLGFTSVATPLGELFLQEDVLGEHASLRHRAFDHEQQVIGIDGLGEEVHRAFFHGGDRILDAGVGGHHHDRQFGVEFFGGAKDAKAVADGKLQVGKDDDWASPLQLLHSLGLIDRFENGVAMRFERMPQHGPE